MRRAILSCRSVIGVCGFLSRREDRCNSPHQPSPGIGSNRRKRWSLLSVAGPLLLLDNMIASWFVAAQMRNTINGLLSKPGHPELLPSLAHSAGLHPSSWTVSGEVPGLQRRTRHIVRDRSQATEKSSSNPGAREPRALATKKKFGPIGWHTFRSTYSTPLQSSGGAAGLMRMPISNDKEQVAKRQCRTAGKPPARSSKSPLIVVRRMTQTPKRAP